MLLTQEKYYTVEQVAEILNLHPETVRRQLQSRQMRGVKIGKEWRVSERDLREHLNPDKDQGKK